MSIGQRDKRDLVAISVTAEEAIDEGASSVEEYLESRDMRHITAIAGDKLTTFTLRQLPPALIAECKAHPSPVAEWMAFSFGCKSVSDNVGLQWLGGGKKEQRRIDPESMDDLPVTVWEELGAVILERGNLTVGQKHRFEPAPGWRQTRRLVVGSNASCAETSEATPPAGSSSAVTPPLTA